ncbi:Sphingosine N-acyltransferase lag1 [Coemansia sp. Benny D115]|nr:Sphingosine N-acyltransferase lag1 [Coemansia sp. Benny D115]
MADAANVAVSKRRLRQRRNPKPSAELDEEIGVDGKPMQRLSKNKNIILNTRNPFIIFLAKHEISLSLMFLAFVHGSYWLGHTWPELWVNMQHRISSVDDAPKVNSGFLGHGRYVRGIHDFKFVFYWIVQLIALRSVLLHHILPLVARALGVTSLRKSRRFCEMGWFVLYISTSWFIGFRVWQDSPYYMNTRNLYTNYPEEHMVMPYGLKWYYLVQTAFWLFNVYTIHVEERRKDHMEMLTHHLTTITLVLLSYTFHFTRFGHAFMLIMDFPDIFLSSAKIFRYLGHEIMPNILFGMFSVSWIATKHYLCIKMMISIWTQGTSLVPQEKRFPHYPNSYASYPIVGFLWAFLLLLQIILIYWFVLILNVLQKVLIKGEEANDSRSDDEDAGEEEEEDTDNTAVGSDDADKPAVVLKDEKSAA